jgi:hypothetical protein
MSDEFKERRCRNCEHFLAVRDGEDGACLRYPPVLCADGESRFPVVLGNVVCGEFKERKEDENLCVC